MKPHVLAVRLDSAGDVLLMGPAIRALSAGAERVTMLCGPRGLEAAELLPGIAEILVHEAPWIDPEPAPLDREATMSLVKEVLVREVDCAVIFTSFHQSPLPLAMLLRMAAVPEIAAISDDYPGSLLDVRHRVPEDIHEVERALSLASAAGFRLPEGDDGRLRLRALPEPENRDRFGLRSPYFVVHPGASVPARAWSAGRYAALVKALSERGHQVAVTGSPAETGLTAEAARQPPERPKMPGGPAQAQPERATDGTGKIWNLGGLLTLSELAGLLRGAKAVVVGNTGPAHLAAAVGTPVVSLFAPTVPAVRWRPWKVPHVLLGNQDIQCAGCRAKVCPVPGHPCLEETTETDVIEALDRLLTPVY